MKPDTPTILNAVAKEMAKKIIPQLETDYAKADAGLMVELLTALADEYDQAAYLKFEENNKIRDLFRDAAGIINDPDLKDKITAASTEEPPDIKISTLVQNNNLLSELLITVHAYLEGLESDLAREIETNIWQILSARIMNQAPVAMSVAKAKMLLASS